MEDIDGSEKHVFQTNGVRFTQKTLEEMIKKELFGKVPKTNSLMMTTGKGGVREIVKAFNHAFNVKNPDQITFRQILTVFRNGWVKPLGNGAYLIS